MSDFFMRHYEQVEEESYEHMYVDECVEKTRIPGKFRVRLEPLGVKFDQSKKHYEESLVDVELPKGWKLRDAGRRLEILDADGQRVFSASVINNRGFQKWSEDKY